MYWRNVIRLLLQFLRLENVSRFLTVRLCAVLLIVRFTGFLAEASSTTPSAVSTAENNSETACICNISERRNFDQKVKRASGLENVDETGVQVMPQLTLQIADVFSRPLMAEQGAALQLGDYVRFIINLTRDCIYESLLVRSCTMSTSYNMPDPNAQTRVLMVNGCPVPGEVTGDSWYWTTELSTPAHFVINTQPVKIFKLSSSEYVYLHCLIQMCFVGYPPCHQSTKENCTEFSYSRKKREADNHLVFAIRHRRSYQGITDVNQTLAIRVLDPSQQSDSSAVEKPALIALICLSILVGLIIIIVITVLIVVFVCRKSCIKNWCQRRQQQHPFVEQRITVPIENRRNYHA